MSDVDWSLGAFQGKTVQSVDYDTENGNVTDLTIDFEDGSSIRVSGSGYDKIAVNVVEITIEREEYSI